MAKVNLLNRKCITVSPLRITRLRLDDTEFSLPNRITRVRLGDTGFSLLKCITNFVTEEYHQMIHVTLNSLLIWVTKKTVVPPVAFQILLVTRLMV